MLMTAKQLAEKLLENPNATVEVGIAYPDFEYLERDYTERRNDLYQILSAKKIKLSLLCVDDFTFELI